LEVDTRAGRFTAPGGVTVSEGDVISIDGTSGAVYLGEVPVADSPVVEYFEQGLGADADDLVKAVDRIMRHADQRRRLGVHANADTGEDCARARRFGAGGVGLSAPSTCSSASGASSWSGSSWPRTRRAGGPRWTRSSRCSAATSRRSWTPWTACRSPSG